jgi:heat shock protein HtpX
MRVGHLLRYALLAGILTALAATAGWVLYQYGIFGSTTQAILVMGAVMVAINFAMYWWSANLVLRMHRARVLASREDHPRLWDAVAKAAREAGMPMPTVALVPSPIPNAFATGRGPRHAVVAATQGILDMLDDEELGGVLAHEMGHVKNRDMLVTTAAAALAGIVVFAARILFWNALFGGGDRERSPLGAIVGILFIVLAPVVAMLVQMAVSRGREYKADATGARDCGKPLALASALEKMEAFAQGHQLSARHGNTAASSLYIVNPFRAGAMAAMFSTHPPTAERVRRLREMHR